MIIGKYLILLILYNGPADRKRKNNNFLQTLFERVMLVFEHKQNAI